ncbi:hypothetical protein L1987_87492 [Smallanthus sonchifolius]|nr:hypothetical protein L1987_87492 [Smallanthus sonchifolius]
MSLPNTAAKELFLHIACFFIDKDLDYVVKILEHDYSAISGIKTLVTRCLLSVSPNKKLVMHRLLQEMGKNIVRQESPKFPLERSRVWLSSDSYNILRKGMGSKWVEGLALDMKMLTGDNFTLKSSELKTDALKNMDSLKLLQLNFAELRGSYEYVSENLRWLCWHGFHLRTIPSDLCMGNLVAIDMSFSNLEVFEPPTVLHSLQILNLKDSHNLIEIRNILKIPNLETLILWNCYSLKLAYPDVVRVRYNEHISGAYYLTRRDFYELMEVGRLTPDWFRILVGDTIDYTEVRGWRKTGRPKQVNDPSFTELKIVRCIINGPELEDIYHITEMSKSSIGNKTVASTSSLLEGQIISGTRSELIDEAMEEIYEKQYSSGDETVGHFVSTFGEITMEESDPYSHEQKESEGMSKTFVYDEIRESTSPPQGERLKSVVTHEVIGEAKKKIVLAVNLSNQNKRQEMMNALSALQGIESVSFDEAEGKVTVIGVVDPWLVLKCAIKIRATQIISFGHVSERLAEQHESEVKSGFESGKDDKPAHESRRKKKRNKLNLGEKYDPSR